MDLKATDKRDVIREMVGELVSGGALCERVAMK